MEERWFQVGDSKPVTEGDMTLLVAKILAPKLRALGAKVSFVRDKTQPATSKRPADLEEVSKKILLRAGDAHPREDYAGPDDPEKEHTVRWHNELLFYRNSEIRQRAELVNKEIKPDLVICLHFNAEAWNEPTKPTLIDRNHLHALINGSYLPPEIEFDDERFEMLERLLSRTHAEEVGLAETVAQAMARRTQLPPYQYTTENVTPIGTSGYVYLRNLLATRIYNAPVIYLEPYVMNSDEVFWRIQEGDYDGIRNVNGRNRPSIYPRVCGRGGGWLDRILPRCPQLSSRQEIDRVADILQRHVAREMRRAQLRADHKTHFAAFEFLVGQNSRQNFRARDISRQSCRQSEGLQGRDHLSAFRVGEACFPHRDFASGDDAQADRFAVQKASVTARPLDRVADGVAEI